MTLFESVGFILALFILIEIAYQLVNFAYKKMSNIPIRASQEEE